MSGTTIKGSECAFEVFGVVVAGIGNWKYSPGASDELDDTEFLDTSEKIILGIRKRGSITFDGLAKIANAEQEKLKRAQVNGTQITSMALRIASSLALEPCRTTGYHSPLSTTGNLTQPGYVNVTGFDISSAHKDLAKISFTAVVSGDMVEAAV
jgi:hypothetical protein